MVCSDMIKISDFTQIASVIVALLLGFISILQTGKQIKNSNKQSLFDKRCDIFLLLQHMDKLCNENLNLLHADDSMNSLKSIASLLTNSSRFYRMCNIFDKNQNNDAQVEFLSLLEDLKDFGVKSKLLFPKKYAQCISDYFESYADLLNEMHKYDVLLNDIKSSANTIVGTDEQRMNYQQSALNGDLAENVRKDVRRYKESLFALHNEYESIKKQLIKYLTLTERD